MKTGMRSKLCTGTGDGSWNSMRARPPRVRRGRHPDEGERPDEVEEEDEHRDPEQNAETETQSLRNWRFARVGDDAPRLPEEAGAKSGAKVELKKTNIGQKWIFPSRSFSWNPVIFGTQ